MATVEQVRLPDGATLWTESTHSTARPSDVDVGMVFLHGGPGLWDTLAPVAAMVADLVGTHRFDQRGCGRSTASDGFTIAQLVADLETLRVHWGYRTWVVFGHSFGASLAIHYASHHPEAVAGLVYCSGVGFGRRWYDEYRLASDARLSADQLSRRTFLDGRQRTWPEEVEWRQLRWLPDFADVHQAASWALADAAVELAINDDFHRALWTEVSAETEAEQRQACRSIAAPSLVLHGAGDPRPAWSAAEVAAALPDADLVVIPAAGHNPWREQPDATGRAVRDLLRRALG
jgi:proline iminopeptidase